jgi:hypothetical protein
MTTPPKCDQASEQTTEHAKNDKLAYLNSLQRWYELAGETAAQMGQLLLLLLCYHCVSFCGCSVRLPAGHLLLLLLLSQLLCITSCRSCR